MAMFKIKFSDGQIDRMIALYVEKDIPSDQIVIIQDRTDELHPGTAKIMNNYPWNHDKTRWAWMTLRKRGVLPKLRH